MCGKYIKSVRLRISRYYIAHLYTPQKGYDVDFYDWDPTGAECTAVFRCSNNHIDRRQNHTKEDLEEYIIKTFGANIISAKMANNGKSRQLLDKDNFKINTVVENNPALKLLSTSKQTSYKSIYDLDLTKIELQNVNFHLKQLDKSLRDEVIKPIKIKGDNINTVRIGTW